MSDFNNGFNIEFNGRGLSDRMEAGMRDEAFDRLQQLADGHDDLIGAAINVRRPAKSETDYLFRPSVVVYARPEHVAGDAEAGDAFVALREALDAVERQIRERREKLREHWKQPGNSPAEQEIAAIVAAGSGDPSAVHD